MLRILGLDYGSVTVGVALSDPLLITAQGIETIRRKHANKLRKTFARIEELISEKDVNLIVLGYPIKLDSEAGTRAKETEEFAEALKRRTGLEVVLWDERLTTVSAHRYLDEAGLDYKKKAEVVDTVAAGIILQSYLDYLANNPDKKAELEKNIQ
ncbi:MAG: Holliday junction resolvase RuvX [Lachnospiraceae bacterium]|nr:Holliday junction resolvase RuvX [Lachnospiraceae bacterium]